MLNTVGSQSGESAERDNGLKIAIVFRDLKGEQSLMLKRLSVVLAGALFLSLPTFGDEWNKKTILTFSQPVEIPGVILPAGQYVFKLADSPANRHIVQVFNADQDQIFATILAIPHYRMQPADKTLILFDERRPGQPQAIHAWFYPGAQYGQEFVYPRGRALELARDDLF